MSLFPEVEIDSSVYLCTIECFIRQANIAMKFPCNYFITWSTPNGKSTVTTARHPPQQNQVLFDQKIALTTQMLYDHNKLQFLKRETQIELFLVSKSRPDQNKLVGRVTIDIAKVINVSMYADPTEFKLNFCSIEGSLIMQFAVHEQKLTSMSIQNLDRSSFIDYISQTALKTQPKNHSIHMKQMESMSFEKDNKQKSPKNGENGKSSPTSMGDKMGFFSSKRERSRPKLDSSLTNQNMQESLKVRKSIDPTIKNKQSPQENTVNKRASLQQKTQVKEKIEGKLQKKNNQILKLNVDIPAARQRIHNEKRQFDYFKTDKEAIKQVNSGLFARESSKEAQQNTLKESFNMKIVQSNNYELKTSILDQQMATLRLKISEYEELLKIAQKDKSVLTNEKAKLIQQRSKHIQERSEWQKQLNQQQQREKKNKDEKQRLFQAILNKNKIIQELDDEVNQKAAAINELKDELNRYDSKQFHQNNNDNPIEELVQNSKQLQNKNQELVKIIRQLETTNNELTNKLRLLQSTNQQLLEKCREYDRNMATYGERCIQLEKQIKILEQENQQYHDHFSNEDNNHDKLVNQLREYQSQHFDLSIKLQAIQKEYSQVNQQIAQKDSLIAREKQMRCQIEEQMTKIKNIYEESKAEYAKIYAELREEQEKLGEMEFIYHQQRQKNEQLELQLAQLSANTQSNEQDIKNIAALQKQNNQLKELVKQLQSAFSSRQLQQKDTALMYETQLEAIKLKLEEVSEELMQADHERQMSDNERRILKDQIEILESKIVHFESISEEANLQREQLVKFQQKITSMTQQIQSLDKEKSHLTAEVYRLSQNTQKTQASTQQTSNWEERCKQNEQMIGKLNSHLEQQINQNNELEEAVIRYMQKEAKMKETLAVLEQQSKEIFMLVQQKQQNEQTYQKMIADLQTELESLRNTNLSNSNSNINSPTNVRYQSTPQRKPQDNNEELMKMIEKLTVANEELSSANSHLHQLNDELNEEISALSNQHNESKNKFEAQIVGLTQEINSLDMRNRKQEDMMNARCRQLEKIVKGKEVQIEIWKSRIKDKEGQKQVLEVELNRVRIEMEQLQEEKFGLQSITNQKDIKILQLQESNLLILARIEERKDTGRHEELAALFIQLKSRLLQRNISADWQSLLQSILDKSMGGQQACKMMNLQQKCRLLSKQLQKLKAQMLKTDWRNQHQKMAFMGLFKKCEGILSQLIRAVESLNINQSSFL